MVTHCARYFNTVPVTAGWRKAREIVVAENSCKKRYWRAVGLLLCLLLLQGCDDSSVTSQSCDPVDGIAFICGFEGPEDLVPTPDNAGLLVSELGSLVAAGGVEEGDSSLHGRISFVDLATRERRVLFNADSVNDFRRPNPIWGDPSCEQIPGFAPHGIDLVKRGQRYQLLVVNHAGRDSIEFFELLNSGGEWQLMWQGCVEAPDDGSFNDVAGMRKGFYTTRFGERNPGVGAFLAMLTGAETGHVWRWTLQDGFIEVPGSRGSMPNGVLVSEDGRQLFINYYGESKLSAMSIGGEERFAVALEGPDNSNWDAGRKKLLVTGREVSMFKMLRCIADIGLNCPLSFEVVEVNVANGERRTLYASDDGKPFGAATAATRVGDKLYIGSFAGRRILVAPISNNPG